MKPVNLIALNRQLCVRQPKSNPYRLRIGQPVPLREPGSRRTPVLGLSPGVTEDGSVGKRGRCGWLWSQFTVVLFSAMVGFAIVGVQRLEYRRAEYHLATQLRKQEESMHKVERLNAALVAQVKRMAIGVPGVPGPAVQPASFRRPPAADRTTAGRL
ncbi:MAG TPA: hypothetical protein PLW35_06945 [Verrucomicrobiota bacterium]|nr:hypothetical protein [Verrucomicrobiota bacterium]